MGPPQSGPIWSQLKLISSTATLSCVEPDRGRLGVEARDRQISVEAAKHYNYFRDYDPAIGRYLESDPIGLEAGLNTFLYVSAAPLGLSDVTGLASGKKPSFIYPGCSDTQILRCVEHCRSQGRVYKDCTQTYVKTPGVKPNTRFIDYTCVCKDKDDGGSSGGGAFACGDNCKKAISAAGVILGTAFMCIYSLTQ